MKKEYTYIALAIVLIVIIAGVAASGFLGTKSVKDPVTPANQPALKTLNVGYLPTNGHALVFIAQEQGFFRQQGLDVQLLSFPNSAEGLNAIVAGKIDTGGFGPAPLVYAAKGAPVTVIGGLMGSGAGVIARPDKAGQFTTITDFKGKTIATVRMSSGDIHFRGAFQNAGLDLKKDITIQELESPAAVLDAVKAGKVDAGIVWTPYMEMAQNQGLSVVLYTDQYYPNHPCCRISALTDNIAKDKGTYVKFEKALIEAYGFSKTNPTASVDAVSKYVKINKTVIAQALDSPHFYISPDPNLHGDVKTYGLLQSIGYINSTVKIEDHIDTSVYKQALDELSAQNQNDAFYQGLQSDYKTMDS